MKKLVKLFVLGVVFIFSACGTPSATRTATPRPRPTTVPTNPAPATEVPDIPTGQPCSPDDPGADGIGCISHINDVLEKGANPNNFQPINGIETLLNGDFLQLTNGGKGLMEFGRQLKIIIFNDTQVGDIQLESGSRFDLTLLLAFGGFLGDLDISDGSATVHTPNNGMITVYGTQFFVVLNPGTGVTSVGNFDGRIDVASGGQLRNLPPGYFLQFPPNGLPGPQIAIPFTPADFEAQADNFLSPVVGFEDMSQQSIDAAGDPFNVGAQVIKKAPNCGTVAITDGSPEADEAIKLFQEILLEGGCDFLFTTDVVQPPDPDMIFNLLAAIIDEVGFEVLYFPVEQGTANMILDISREFDALDNVWLIDREGLKRQVLIR